MLSSQYTNTSATVNMSYVILPAWLFFWTGVLTLEYCIETRNEGDHPPPLLLLQVKGHTPSPPRPFILEPVTSQPSPHINIHCKSLCMGPAGTWGSTDTSLGKKSWFTYNHTFFELNGLRGCERFCGFPPNHFSTSLARKKWQKDVSSMQNVWLQGKKYPTSSFPVVSSKSCTPLYWSNNYLLIHT